MLRGVTTQQMRAFYRHCYPSSNIPRAEAEDEDLAAAVAGCAIAMFQCGKRRREQAKAHSKRQRTSSIPDGGEAKPKKLQAITFAEYGTIAGILERCLQERIDSGDRTGMQQGQLAKEYCKATIDEIDSDSAFQAATRLVNAVIRRLVDVDEILKVVGEGDGPEEARALQLWSF